MSKEIVYTCNGCPLAPCSTDPSLGRFKTEKEIGACGAVIAVQNEALKKQERKLASEGVIGAFGGIIGGI